MCLGVLLQTLLAKTPTDKAAFCRNEMMDEM